MEPGSDRGADQPLEDDQARDVRAGETRLAESAGGESSVNGKAGSAKQAVNGCWVKVGGRD